MGGAEDAGEDGKEQKEKVCVFGSGSFGTAMACVAARNGHDVRMLTRRQSVADEVNSASRNPSHLSDVSLPKNIRATTSPADALASARFVIHCIPVQGTEEFLNGRGVLSSIPNDCRIICCSKGIETSSLEMMHQLLPRIIQQGKCVSARSLGISFGFLSGPTFAEPLATGQPSGAVLAARTLALARECASLFASSIMRIYPSTDIIGVEACGALKNVYALLAGGLEGLPGHGINTVSLLTTRGAKEISRLAVAMGGKEHTMASVAGMGDLWLTTLGGSSRNKRVGYELATSGKRLQDILDERRRSLQGIAEGVATTPAACSLARKLNVHAPLIEAANSIMNEELQPRDAVHHLMLKPTHVDRPVDQRHRHIQSALYFAGGILTGIAVFLVKGHKKQEARK